jgi:hypothetical protein
MGYGWVEALLAVVIEGEAGPRSERRVRDGFRSTSGAGRPRTVASARQIDTAGRRPPSWR